MPVTRKRREPRDPEWTRRSLLETGAQLFAESGYEGVRVEALARKAGVNKAMINYHFGGKRKLYETILVSVFSELAGRVRELERSSRPPADLLREFIDGVADVARQTPGFTALVLREVLSTGRISPQLLPLKLKLLVGVRGIIERGIREGSFRKVDATVAYLNLIGGLAFFFATEPARRRVFATQRLGAPPSAESYVAYVQELMQVGLARAPRSKPSRGASA